jgi:hypothetical protein
MQIGAHRLCMHVHKPLQCNQQLKGAMQRWLCVGSKQGSCAAAWGFHCAQAYLLYLPGLRPAPAGTASAAPVNRLQQLLDNCLSAFRLAVGWLR